MQNRPFGRFRDKNVKFHRLCTSHRSRVFSLCLALSIWITSFGATAAASDCFAKKDEDRWMMSGSSERFFPGPLFLGNAAFRLQLDLSRGVHADSVENRLTGQTFDLGKGAECGLRFSATLDRIELLGWKQTAGGQAGKTPDQEKGFAQGYHQPSFDDSSWSATRSPWALGQGGYSGFSATPNPAGYNWYRVQFDLPDTPGQPVTIGLGGCGLYDFGDQRFFVNGVLFHERTIEEQEWTEHEPIVLKPGDPAYAALHFGQSNAVAVQAWSMFDCRPARLKQLDTGKLFESARLLLMMDQFVTVGPAYRDVSVTGVKKIDGLTQDAQTGHVQIHLETTPPLGPVVLHYQWKAAEPVLHKWLEFQNSSGTEQLLLDVELGDYSVAAPCSEGFQGFPVFLQDDIFFTIAHPTGVAQGRPGRIRVRHFPGRYLKPGATFTSKQAICGVAETPGKALEAFHQCITKRSRRMKLVELTGKKTWAHCDGLSVAWGRPEPWGMVDAPSERVCLEILDTMEHFQKDLGMHWDYFWLDAGWWEYQERFSMKVFNRDGFPEGVRKTVNRADELGIRMGLWYTRGGECPIPAKNMAEWKEALRHNVEENGFKGFKFDGMWPKCFRKDHAEQRLHLPGKYSAEAVADTNIEIYRYATKLVEDMWIFGYWGHDSPWWLEHVCVAEYHGLNHEMGRPSAVPTLYRRDSVMVAIDQAEQYRHNYPPLGRYTLGVWTGEGWAQFGLERWLPNAMMDMCRGTGMFHFWTDLRRFTPAERKRLSRLGKVLKNYPDCFLNTARPIGDPWKGGPYGYACSDGQRVFLALSNPTFLDQKMELSLDESLGLQQKGEMAIYRHSLDPAHLTAEDQSWHFGETLSWYLRPNEVVLMEVTPVAEGPALPGPWKEDALAVEPPQPPAIKLPMTLDTAGRKATIKSKIGPYSTGACLTVVVQTQTAAGKHYPLPKGFTINGKVGYDHIGQRSLYGGYNVTVEGAWAVSKIPVAAFTQDREIELEFTIPALPKGIIADYAIYFLPWVTPDNI